jgi:hypothetical protein
MTDTANTPLVKFWKDEIDLYERTTNKWLLRGRKIYKRYKDVRSPREEAVTRFNVLWSNVQTRLPALYARDPKPEVERRFKDRDPVGRSVAEVLERCLDYTIQHVNPFGRILRQVVLDFELPGRGTLWVRYSPTFNPGPENEKPGGAPGGTDLEADDAQDKAVAGGTQDDEEQEEGEELGYEETLLDYVYWEDFGHTWARTWDEVRAVWRRVYLTREEIGQRFKLRKGQLDQIPLDWSPKGIGDGKVDAKQKKAIVYEIWDKEKKEALWIVKNYPKELDVKDDPLELEHFFPCPPPLYANLASDELIPTPNFVYYHDQALEIDELSTRISAIGKALKVCGIYDSSAAGLDRLLAEGVENTLIPIDGWMALKEKGGLEGVMQLIPLKEIAEALASLREQRQTMIDDVYQITGLSDIIRGLSEPEETATAQQIKGQFAVLRISDAQQEVQRFCRDTLRICAQIISGYALQTLKKISGVKLLTNAEKAQLHAQLSPPPPPMPGMPGMGGGALPAGHAGAPLPGAPPAGGLGLPPAPPGAGGEPPGGAGAPVPPPGGAQGGGSVSPERLKLLKEPSWEEVEALLRNPVLREFRIDVETDSTIRTDEDADRTARMEFIEAVGKMINEASAVPKPMIPAAGELILFGIRGFKVARNLERVFEDAIEQLKDMPPPPDPEMMKAQAQAQSAKEVAGIKAQTDIQIANAQQAAQAKEDQLRSQFEAQRSVTEQQAKAQHEQQLEDIKARFEAERTQFETASKEKIASADNATKLQIAAMEHEHEKQLEGMKQAHEQKITSMTQDHEKALAVHSAESGKETEKVKGEEGRKTEGVKADKAKELESVKGSESRKTEEVKGEQVKAVTKLKPKAEAEAKVEEEKKGKEPTLEAIEKLTQALKDVRKPRKVVRDKDGRIAELH